MTDFLLLEKVHRMIAGVSKPRLLYKKGIYLKGFFRPYMSMRDYTCCSFFDDINTSVPVIVRFSSMLGDTGTADTRRNVKCMAVKFCGSHEKMDIICQNMPVFFINKESTIEELACSFTYRAPFDRINSSRLWQLAVDHPESLNGIIRLFSRDGISDSFVSSRWYCVYTYIWNNVANQKKLARFRWIPDDVSSQKSKKMSRISAEFMAGFDPDTAHEQIEEAVREGRFPAFELQVQLADYRYISHPDYTKQTLCWNDGIYKPVTVGVMKLTEVLGWGGAECDSISFAPGNVADGIELYSDSLTDIINYIYRISAVERGAEK